MEVLTPLQIIIALGKKLALLEIEHVEISPKELCDTDPELKLLLETTSACFKRFEELGFVMPMSGLLNTLTFVQVLVALSRKLTQLEAKYGYFDTKGMSDEDPELKFLLEASSAEFRQLEALGAVIPTLGEKFLSENFSSQLKLLVGNLI